jgi:hypothetical protein
MPPILKTTEVNNINGGMKAVKEKARENNLLKGNVHDLEHYSILECITM